MGSAPVTVEEFQRLFDEGSDQIDLFIDWSKAEVQTPGSKTPITLRVVRTFSTGSNHTAQVIKRE
jgi:hypothetical protein